MPILRPGDCGKALGVGVRQLARSGPRGAGASLARPRCGGFAANPTQGERGSSPNAPSPAGALRDPQEPLPQVCLRQSSLCPPACPCHTCALKYANIRTPCTWRTEWRRAMEGEVVKVSMLKSSLRCQSVRLCPAGCEFV